MQRSLSLPNHDSNERLALGVAVAATAERDAETGQDALERACGECRAVVGAERERPGRDGALEPARSISAIASRALQRVSMCQATISRVQQSIAGH